MILISGYYGYGNWGDEAILAALLADLSNLGVDQEQIRVLSGQPKRTEEWHGVKAIPRYRVSSLVHSMKHSQLLISGGGSLLQDSTSLRSIPYYLGMIEFALANKVPVVIYAQGIGPVRRRMAQRWIQRVVSKAAAVSLRDQNSLALMKQWGVPTTGIQLSADPVFRFVTNKQSKTAGLTINLRPYPQWTDHISGWVQEIKSWMALGLGSIQFVALGPGDQGMGERLRTHIPHLVVRTPQTYHEAMSLMGRYELTVSMRLHGIIFAAINGSYPIGLDYDPKIPALARQLGTPVFDPCAYQCLGSAIQLAKINIVDASRKLQQKVECLQQQAHINGQLIKEVLYRPVLEESYANENIRRRD